MDMCVDSCDHVTSGNEHTDIMDIDTYTGAISKSLELKDMPVDILYEIINHVQKLDMNYDRTSPAVNLSHVNRFFHSRVPHQVNVSMTG